MKKLKQLFILVLVFTMVSVMTINSSAIECTSYEKQDGSTLILFDDGSFIEISPIRYLSSKAMNADSSNAKATQTTLGQRDVYYSDSSGNIEWEYTLTANFTYTPGVSSTCTNATYSSNINANGWTLNDAAATRSGNTAYGVGVYIKKILLIKVKEVDIDISISCDSYGNLS